MTTKISEYKGSPILEIHDSADCTDKWPVRMGVKKLRSVMANLDAVNNFITYAESKQAPQTETPSASVSLPNLGV